MVTYQKYESVGIIMDSHTHPRTHHARNKKRNDGLPRLDHGGRKIGEVVQDTGDHHFLLLML